MASGNSKEENRLITISDWDAPLPVGDWSGPLPTPLFLPRLHEEGEAEAAKTFQLTHIRVGMTREQAAETLDWVTKNIPEKFRWLALGLEGFHPSFPVIFAAMHSSEVSEADEKFLADHPEVREDAWDEELDVARRKYLEFVRGLGCHIEFLSPTDALDDGVLERVGYPRPNAMMVPDLSTNFGDKKLWHYFSLPKFAHFIQKGEIWFSRPQYFDDPHEFSIDESSQQALIQWRLNAFCDEYNRAVRTGRTEYLRKVGPLIESLETTRDGVIKRQSIKLSQLSSALLSSLRADLQAWQESYFISCWRLSAVDSVAIWNQYASLSEGVAIAVAPDRVRESLRQNGDIRLGLVEYVDLSAISTARFMPPFMYKDIRYQAEEEARFYFRIRNQEDSIRGIGMSFDVSRCVEDVFVAPNATGWFKEVVANLCASNGLSARIVSSPLGQMPQKF